MEKPVASMKEVVTYFTGKWITLGKWINFSRHVNFNLFLINDG